MDFDHYNNDGAAMAADLVNTVGSISGTEYLPDEKALLDFVRHYDVEPYEPITAKDLEQVKALRSKIRAVFECKDDTEIVARLNALLEQSKASPWIAAHDGHPWHFHYVQNDAPLARRLAAIMAMGLAVVVCQFGAERLGRCDDERCDDAYVDLSRNHSKRYCSDKCATRANVAAYRARKKATKV